MISVGSLEGLGGVQPSPQARKWNRNGTEMEERNRNGTETARNTDSFSIWSPHDFTPNLKGRKKYVQHNGGQGVCKEWIQASFWSSLSSLSSSLSPWKEWWSRSKQPRPNPTPPKHGISQPPLPGSQACKVGKILKNIQISLLCQRSLDFFYKICLFVLHCSMVGPRRKMVPQKLYWYECWSLRAKMHKKDWKGRGVGEGS